MRSHKPLNIVGAIF